MHLTIYIIVSYWNLFCLFIVTNFQTFWKYKTWIYTEAQFKCQPFHVLNLKPI